MFFFYVFGPFLTCLKLHKKDFGKIEINFIFPTHTHIFLASLTSSSVITVLMLACRAASSVVRLVNHLVNEGGSVAKNISKNPNFLRIFYRTGPPPAGSARAPRSASPWTPWSTVPPGTPRREQWPRPCSADGSILFCHVEGKICNFYW